MPGGIREIVRLQKSMERFEANEVSPILLSTINVSNPPTDAELDSAFGDPGDLPIPFVAIIDDNGAGSNEYLAWSDGTNWFYVTGTKAT